MSAVLVTSDSGTDAQLVRNLLQREEFESELNLDPAGLGADFETCRPKVLVFAYKSLEAAERHYLSLYRKCPLACNLPHRTLLLCTVGDTRDAYKLCRAGVFDDYVQFWPFNHDALTLPMAVHRALFALQGEQMAAATAAISAQARRIVELEAQLQAQLEIGAQHALELVQAGAAARAEIGAAFGGLGSSLVDKKSRGAFSVREMARVKHVLNKVEQDALQPALGRMENAIAPVEQWIGGLKTELAVPLEAARSIAEHARSLHRSVLAVDDDRFLLRMLQRVLADAGYEVLCASTAAEALQALRQRAPDMVLLDLELPDGSGLDVLRRLKSDAKTSGIPVLMLTGHGEKDVIVESMAAGACDFIVKPCDRELLLKKMQRPLTR